MSADDDGRIETPKTAPGKSGGVSPSGPRPSRTPTADPTASTTPDGSAPDGGQADGSGDDVDGGTVPAGPDGPRPSSEVSCSDTDIDVSVALAHRSYPAGARVRIQLKVRNISERPCARDLGAGAQEVLVKSGGTRVWSSDDCGNDTSSDVRTLSPGETRTYWVAWPGRGSAPGCPGGQATPPPGDYEVYGRVGQLTSKPFTVALR